MSIERKENVTIVYKGDKITVKGKTFEAELNISGSELSNVYWGNLGKGSAKITVRDIPDPSVVKTPTA